MLLTNNIWCNENLLFSLIEHTTGKLNGWQPDNQPLFHWEPYEVFSTLTNMCSTTHAYWLVWHILKRPMYSMCNWGIMMWLCYEPKRAALTHSMHWLFSVVFSVAPRSKNDRFTFERTTVPSSFYALVAASVAFFWWLSVRPILVNTISLNACGWYKPSLQLKDGLRFHLLVNVIFQEQPIQSHLGQTFTGIRG